MIVLLKLIVVIIEVELVVSLQLLEFEGYEYKTSDKSNIGENGD